MGWKWLVMRARLELVQQPVGLHRHVQLVQRGDAAEVVEHGGVIARDHQRPDAASLGLAEAGTDQEEAVL